MVEAIRPKAYDVNEVFQRKVFEKDGYKLPYRYYIPKTYDCGEKYPLIVFLHGAGERGVDNEKQIMHLQFMFEDPTSPVYDSVVVAPQCPDDCQWVNAPWADGCYSIENTEESRELEAVCGIIDEIRDFCNIDDDRVYVTGLSMGGFGTWDMLSRHGARFAAGIPICGAGDPDYANLLKRLPIWTFHGSDDGAVPVAGTRQMYAAIKMAGGENIRYTEYDGAGHGIWDTVYRNRDVIDWLFSQNRAERRAKAEKSSKIKKIAAASGAVLSAAAAVCAIIIRKKK